MDPMKLQMIEEFMIFSGAMATLVCATGLGAVWIRSRNKQVVAESPNLTARLDEISARLAQIENAAESTAVEVERVSEGQRFVTRLLAERATQPPAQPAALPERSRVGSTTPH